VPDDIDSSNRSKRTTAMFTAIGLVFFFGVGLAGGAAYKIYFGADAGPQIADRASPPSPPGSLAAPAQNFAATTPSTAEEKAVPDLARSEPAVPPAFTPPPAPTPAEATQPHAPSAAAAQAAPPPVLASLTQAPQAAPAEPPALSSAEIAPAQPDALHETQAAKPQRVATTPPQKPMMVAKAQRSTPPQTVAPHRPPTGSGNAVGPYRVQFGAFAHEDNARRVQWAIEATGLKVEVSQEPGPSGRPLFFLRSASYPDYASALSAAQTVRNRVQHFVNAIPIDYAILSDHSAPEQQAQR
jgi:hypothetical protein